MSKKQLCFRARSCRKLSRFVSEYIKRSENISIETIDDVVGAEETQIPPEPTLETDEPIEVRPWYKCGLDVVECSAGKFYFPIPCDATEAEIAIVRKARMRRIEEMKAAQKKRDEDRARIMDKLYGVGRRK